MDNALRIDLEYWHTDNFVMSHVSGDHDDQMPESVVPVMALLDKYDTKATFAVLGTVAERYPDMVKDIHDRGHEIASHGYSHKLLYDLDEAQFEEEIVKSISVLSSITGERPIGFVAPTFSVDNTTRWALDVLRRHSFSYDTSLSPAKTILYGEPKAPLYPYRPSRDDVTREDPQGDLVEFPLTAVKLGVNVPVVGGFYHRVLPSRFMEFALRRINRKRPGLVYIHPWETYPATPRVNTMRLYQRFINYYGIGHALGKLERLLDRFRFKPIREVLKGIGLL